jgi:2-polyprenyl-3-methyl-5-hydroxy-6-metoxy-1,4-benzoquinol methylase
MDDPAASRDDLDVALGYLRHVNRRFAGTLALLHYLDRWRRSWPTDRPINMLDIATGSADIPIAAVNWARGRGIDLRVTAVDLHPTTIDLAREHVRRSLPAGEAGRITVLQADALRLTDQFPIESFDCVHAGLFLHHLPEIQALTVLRIMDRLIRPGGGLVWNDLVRSRLSRTLVNLLLIGRPRIVRHDAAVSIEAGFTRREAMDFARRLDLTYLRYRRFLFYRFTLAGRKPGP